MAILNYTTAIKAEKTVGEIQGMLAAAGASAVLIEYGPGGVLAALSFRINTVNGQLSFRLPARYKGVYKRLQDEGVPRRLQTEEQAARVSWRIIKDWVKAQLALVEAEQAELTEVFLPYLQDPNTGDTVYQKLKSDGFKKLTHDPKQ